MSFNRDCSSILFGIILVLFNQPTFAAPRFSHFETIFAQKSATHDRFTDRSDFFRPPHPASIEGLRRSQDETEILNRLRVSRPQMEGLVKEYKINSKEFESLQKLMRILSSTKKSSSMVKDQLLLKRYFQFLINIPDTDGTFHLSPSVMHRGIKKWRRMAKNYMTLLLEAATEESTSQNNKNRITREKAYELVDKKRNFILARAAFEGSLDTVSALYAIGKASADEVSAVFTQAAAIGMKSIEESFEIYDRGVMTSYKINKALAEVKETTEKVIEEFQDLSQTTETAKEEVNAILDEASMISGKSVNEMHTLYDICKTASTSEVKALLAEAAAISGKTIDEVQELYLSAKSMMKQFDATISRVVGAGKNTHK